MNYLRRTVVLITMLTFALLSYQAYAQSEPTQPTFSKEEIEQLVAPIALYPDPLIAQILMASTYPLEVVSAARWVEANPKLKDKALEDALQQQTWDPSVKSLTTVPQVLDMLNKQLDMTEKLGDAFLAQQKDVLDAIQHLRAKAQDNGNLKSTKEQVVASSQDQGNDIITISPASPEVIYVPTYDPNVVYGEWPYPSYLPYYYYPPGYELGTALISFGVGLAVGNAIWGNFDWHRGYVNIDVNRYNHFNRTNINDPNWHHDVAHRKGVEYRDKATQLKYGKDQLKANESRESFREKAEQGQRDLRQDSERAKQGKRDQNRADQGGLKDKSGPKINQKAKPTQKSKAKQPKRPATAQGVNKRASSAKRASQPRMSGSQRAANRGGGGRMERRGGGGGRRR